MEEHENRGALPVCKGHILTEEDFIIRPYIPNILCRLETSREGSMYVPGMEQALEQLKETEADGLLTLKGRAPFTRYVGMGFDLRLMRHKPEIRIFSYAV